MRTLISNMKILTLILFFSLIACETPQKSKTSTSVEEQFLKRDSKAEELFRVIVKSDSYTVSQMRDINAIKKIKDSDGDMYICNQLKKFDKMNEIREGIIHIWLYPDTGKMMKVRPMKLSYLIEIDNLIMEDIQRWKFNFPRKDIDPQNFTVKYWVVLRKLQSDDEIMKEIREKIKRKKSKE